MRLPSFLAALVTSVVTILASFPIVACAAPRPDTAPSPEAGAETSATSTTSNRLANASSPYLLLHRDNPVDWYPWGDEALTRAREENKPIFLSVGYSSCHWCHVMARESFSDPDIAAFMNRNFIAIKVDREERPDIDSIYMTATQLIAGRGGWPNSVFLTPTLEPFFAGTYFPPRPSRGLPGFRDVLMGMHDAWANRRDEVEATAGQVTTALEEVLDRRWQIAEEVPDRSVLPLAYEALDIRFDREFGGFGRGPKFPNPADLLLLFDLVEAEDLDIDQAAIRRMLDQTLDAMARGGIFDHLGGGFHRYTVDRAWLVPHFEKMLYDQGLLLETYARWHELGDARAEPVLRGTARFLDRDMRHADGAYLSAIDAESEGREGAHYVWTRDELDLVLGKPNAGLA
ncbi:MAG: DUF255 domain-containing protein, partial [Acidobacteriota bacterium]